jgi:ribonucleoside-triphosphate reductase
MEDWRVKENSNMSYSLQGLNNYLSSTVIAKYWITRIYPPNIAEAHFSGDMHIHDLGVLGPYCVGWDIKDLLLSGFGGVPGKIESTPAKHFRTALGQVVNFFYTLQGEAAGAQAFSNFDTYLAPFIRYDGLSQKEVEQALQEFFFNMNVPTRVGFQTPFTNVTLDLKVPDFMADEPIIMGGKMMDETYGSLDKEMEMFNIAFARVLSRGDARGRVFTFPIPTYNITKDFDWDALVSQEVFEVAAKYGAPYFGNFVNSDMKPEDVRSMCCRLRIDNRELRKRGGGFFGANPLTGSIGVVTLNLPRIGYLAKDEDEFFERLGALMEIAKESVRFLKASQRRAYTHIQSDT